MHRTASRMMIFIDQSQARLSPGFIAGYSVLCALSLPIGRSHQHYRSFFSVRILFPLALSVMALENTVLAASGCMYAGMVEESGDDVNFKDNMFMKVLSVLLCVAFGRGEGGRSGPGSWR